MPVSSFSLVTLCSINQVTHSPTRDHSNTRNMSSTPKFCQYLFHCFKLYSVFSILILLNSVLQCPTHRQSPQQAMSHTAGELPRETSVEEKLAMSLATWWWHLEEDTHTWQSESVLQEESVCLSHAPSRCRGPEGGAWNRRVTPDREEKLRAILCQGSEISEPAAASSAPGECVFAQMAAHVDSAREASH